MKLERLIVGVAVVAAVAFAAPVVRGEPAPDVQVEAGPEIAPRPWLYLDDPSLAAPMHALAFSRATYTADPSPTRPFGANVGPSLWNPEVRIRSPEPSGFMMPIENCPPPCLVNAM